MIVSGSAQLLSNQRRNDSARESAEECHVLHFHFIPLFTFSACFTSRCLCRFSLSPGCSPSFSAFHSFSTSFRFFACFLSFLLSMFLSFLFPHSVLVFSIRCVEPSKTKTILQTPDSPVFVVLFTLAKRHLIQSDSFKVQFLHLFCLRIDEFISFFKKRHRKLVKPFISVFKKTCLCVLDFHIDFLSPSDLS